MSERKIFTIDDLSSLSEVTPTPSLNLRDIHENKCYTGEPEHPYWVYDCEPAHRHSQSCPDCGNNVLALHGYMPAPRVVHDVMAGILHVDLLLRVPRYRCDRCGRTFNHRFDSILENRQMTTRLYDQIRRDAFIRPFTDVADDFGYTDTTIANIFDEYAQELEARRPQTIAPRVLGIDEKHIVHHMRGVFVDIESGQLLEMTETNKKQDILSTIEKMKDYDTNIKIVTMDMSCGYKAYVQECLPRAKIVVDKYHVYQDLYVKISKTRTRIIEFITERIKKLDSSEEKWLKNILSLSSKNNYLFKFGQEKLMEKPERVATMAEVCKTFPEFNHLRLLKEGFERIYACEEREDAERFADEWGKLIPPKGARQVQAWQNSYGVPPELYSEFRAFKNTALKNWRTEIFNYFDPGCRVTNAATEGLNNMIERFNRLGNGYSFERLRAKALYYHLAAPKMRYVIKTERKPIYEESYSTSYSSGGVGFMTLDYDYPRRRLVGYEKQKSIEEERAGVLRKPLSVFSYLPKNYEAI